MVFHFCRSVFLERLSKDSSVLDFGKKIFLVFCELNTFNKYFSEFLSDLLHIWRKYPFYQIINSRLSIKSLKNFFLPWELQMASKLEVITKPCTSPIQQASICLQISSTLDKHQTWSVCVSTFQKNKTYSVNFSKLPHDRTSIVLNVKE